MLPSIDTIWYYRCYMILQILYDFALLLYSRYGVLWPERIRSVFQCGPYKSELDAVLSENQMRFLAPTPCCCIPTQPQKIRIIYHRQQLSLAWHTSVRLARPFHELLMNSLPSRLPTIFLVYFRLPIGHWGREPAPLQHCTTCLAPLPRHRRAASFRGLHPLCLLGHLNIIKVKWGFFLFHFFNLSSLFKTTEFWQPLQYFQNLVMNLIMKWLKHSFCTDLFPCSERITGGHVCLSAWNRNIHAHWVPFTHNLQQWNRTHGPSLTHTPAPLKPQSETLRFP